MTLTDVAHKMDDVGTAVADADAGLVACHECDQLHRRIALPEGGRAFCRRCGAALYREVPGGLDRALALYASAFILLIIANTAPFLALKIGGRVEQNQIYSGARALYELGMPELGVVVLLTSVVFPLLTIGGMLYLLVPVRLGVAPPAMGHVYRWVTALTPWSLIGVFVLGTLIAFVKLQDLATVVPGIGLYALGALLVIYSAARVSFDPAALWRVTPWRDGPTAAQVRDGRWVSCHACTLLQPAGEGHACRRCGAPLHARITNSLDRTMALVMAAAVLLIPANLYPVMTVTQLGQGQPDTILSGVQHLIEGGMWGLAMIVFFASIVVPVLKLGTLVFLVHSVRTRSRWRPRDRTLLYRVTEVVGAWSMVDVFLVGLLSGLVSLDVLATIEPGVGAKFFAGAVILTMLAASSFDPRLIWDRADGPPPGDGPSGTVPV